MKPCDFNISCLIALWATPCASKFLPGKLIFVIFLAEEKKKEESESEDDDMGFGLFE